MRLPIFFTYKIIFLGCGIAQIRNDNELVCQICKKTFSSKMDIYLHNKAKRDEYKTSLKTFACKTVLETHTRVHTGEKPVVRSTCGKVFAPKTTLKRHIAVQSLERKHKCVICPEGRFFKTKDELSFHIKYHFEPEHECKRCGRKFYQLSDLSSHMKYHSQPTHQCKRCGKNFHSSICLKAHEKTHLR